MLQRRVLARACMLSGLFCGTAAADGTTNTGSVVTSVLPQPQTASLDTPKLFARADRSMTSSGRLRPRACANSDGCFPTGAATQSDIAAAESEPADSLKLGEYGPVSLKFTGTRVKMKLRF